MLSKEMFTDKNMFSVFSACFVAWKYVMWTSKRLVAWKWEFTGKHKDVHTSGELNAEWVLPEACCDSKRLSEEWNSGFRRRVWPLLLNRNLSVGFNQHLKVFMWFSSLSADMADWVASLKQTIQFEAETRGLQPNSMVRSMVKFVFFLCWCHHNAES